MSNEVNNFNQIPNNIVQNINILNKDTNETIFKPSIIQLCGKKSVVYFKQLIELQNVRGDIHFSIDMILWKMGLKDSLNIKKERKYLKEFLIDIHKISLISFY